MNHKLMMKEITNRDAMNNLMRLNKFIASNGIASRRKIDEYILQGRVTVNGETMLELGHKINPELDKVTLDGEAIRTSSKKIYIILNKPKGIITSVSDEKHRTTVIDLVSIKEKIFPVGRLDYDTSGLLLLTNDGELANKLMHPKGEVYKTYHVKLSRPLEEKHRFKLTGGIKVEGKMTAPCKIRFSGKKNYDELFISIYEGRNRQVRNMFEHYGYFVRELERVEYAGIKLDGLKVGEWRYLSDNEINNMSELVKRAADSTEGSVYKKSRQNRKTLDKFHKDLSEKKKNFGDFRKTKSKRLNPDVRITAKTSEERRTKRDSKWGFKSRMKEERNAKLGFRKIDERKDKKDSKKPGSRNYEQRDFMKFSGKKEFKNEEGRFKKSQRGSGNLKKSNSFKKRKDAKGNFVRHNMRGKN